MFVTRRSSEQPFPSNVYTVVDRNEFKKGELAQGPLPSWGKLLLVFASRTWDGNCDHDSEG